MVLAFLLLAGLADWVPARWTTNDPASLELLKPTPINCLLLETNQWSAEFSAKAAETGIATLGLVRPGAEVRELPSRVAAFKLAGLVLEGDFTGLDLGPLNGITVIRLGPRTAMKLDGSEPVIGTNQGVWPGINATDDGSAKAAPSGAPWIDTNTGFLRFVRAASPSLIWMGNVPPKGAAIAAARYLQAIGDAAVAGARWVVALDEDFSRRLLEREETALKSWDEMAAHLRFYEQHKQWREFGLHGQLALVQDVDSGGLISGGILDMISVKHTPVRPVPGRLLSDDRMEGSRMAVNVNPSALSEDKKEILRRFTRGGGTLLTAPPGWKFPPQRADQITLGKDDIETLDSIWKEVNSMTGRRNLGARLFNVSSMLSNLLAGPEGKPVVLQLVNYSDYPVESITAHVLGKYSRATLHEPGKPPRPMVTYEVEEGAATGIDIDKVSTSAALVIE